MRNCRRKQNNQWFCLLGIIGLSLFWASCASGGDGGGDEVAARRTSASDHQAAAHPAKPLRVISLTPSTTEILYGVGAWEQVVAVSQYCDYPAAVSEKPRVEGYRNTNLEQVLNLKPDLVIGSDAQAPFVADKLAALNIPTLFVKSQSLADVYSGMEAIAAATGQPAAGGRLIAQTRDEIEIVRSAVKNSPPRRVLFVVDRVPGTLRDVYAATKDSFLDALVQNANGVSVTLPAERGYGKISKEAIVEFNPEVIIEMVPGSKGSLGEDSQAVWRELTEIQAVREHRVYSLEDASVVHPSQFVGRTARIIAERIQPEAFPDAKH